MRCEVLPLRVGPGRGGAGLGGTGGAELRRRVVVG